MPGGFWASSATRVGKIYPYPASEWAAASHGRADPAGWDGHLGKAKEIRKVRFQVGLVFQYPEYQLFEETVYKDISFGPKNMGLEGGDRLPGAPGGGLCGH